MPFHHTQTILDALIADSHKRYEEICNDMAAISAEAERPLLISLSHRLIRIQRLLLEDDSNSDSDAVGDTRCETGILALHPGDYDGAIKILSELIYLLEEDNPYVKHLGRNTLVFVARYLSSSLKEWEIYVRSLFSVLEMVINNLVQGSSRFSRENHNIMSSNAPSLKTILQKASWATAASVIEVLCDTLKYLKRNRLHDRQRHVFLASMTEFVSGLPWEYFETSFPHTTFERGEADNISQLLQFLANFCRLTCSLVGQCNSASEDDESSGASDSFICEFISTFPRVLSCCLGEQGAPNASVSNYITHKLLMIMLRLSDQKHLDSSNVCSLLHHLHHHFHVLLRNPTVNRVSGNHQSLEGSPFSMTCGNDEIHLQRYAVAIFLRLCFSNLRFVAETTGNSACDNASFCSNPLCRCDGFSELHKWVKLHTPGDASGQDTIYLGNSADFRRKFLQMYLHEDDMLFAVLVELVKLHSFLKKLQQGEMHACEAREGLICGFDHLFNPTSLFHIFLEELQYDHQVLVDYLISKDSGIRCAEYLLRSVRLLSSWHEFGRRKRKMAGSELQFRGENGVGRARDCLVRLGRSVERLHRKKIFPYNPEALLKRLEKFRLLPIE